MPTLLILLILLILEGDLDLSLAESSLWEIASNPNNSLISYTEINIAQLTCRGTPCEICFSEDPKIGAIYELDCRIDRPIKF
jgi:hypothetical protein